MFIRCFYIIFILFYFSASSQNIITGIVNDSEQKILNGATITLSKIDSEKIEAYAICNEKGYFSITVPLNSPFKLQLKISYLGFETKTIIISNESQNITVVLNNSYEKLKEVIVEGNPIEQRGDTIKYSVTAFKSKKDRVIADVIKKMPGIELMPNGAILYQGEPISKYYIEGLDMLEGRYNIANENISADDVSQVQIIENHEHIKILDSLNFSNKAALNIKLKKGVTKTGQIELASGGSPLLFNTNLTPLLFSKKYQALLSYQYANTGKDISKGMNNLYTKNEDELVEKNILSLQELPSPSISKNKWLNNNDHLFSLNTLYRLKKDNDLKINLSYLNTDHQENGLKITNYFSTLNTVSVIEQTQNNFFKNNFQGNLTWERNIEKGYSKHIFTLKLLDDLGTGNINNDSTLINQYHPNTSFNIGYKVKLIKPLGKLLLHINSENSYMDIDENLSITPGQFDDIFNSGTSYQTTNQYTKQKIFFTNNDVGYTTKIGKFSNSSNFGVNYRYKNLLSHINIINDENLHKTDSGFENDLNISNSNIFISNVLSFKSEMWKFSLKTPLYFNCFLVEDKENKDNYEYLNFEPFLQITKKINPFLELNFSGQLANNYSSSESIYSRYILTNYRILKRYDTPLKETLKKSFTLGLQYRNPLNLTFGTISYSYLENKTNLLFENTILNDGSMILVSLLEDNTSNRHALTLNIKKRIENIKTTFLVKSGIDFLQGSQLINGVSSPSKQKGTSSGFTLESDVIKSISMSLNADMNMSKLNVAGKDYSKINNWNSNFDLFFYLNPKNSFSFNAQYYYNNISNENNNVFINLIYKYTFKNMDFRLNWTNITNVKSYTKVYNSSFQSVFSSYTLRPSQVLLSMKFTL